jgi:hypothetical protein
MIDNIQIFLIDKDIYQVEFNRYKIVVVKAKDKKEAIKKALKRIGG